MGSAYDEIHSLLASAESEDGLPAGTLRDVYAVEKQVVHLGLRGDETHNKLYRIVCDVADGMDDPDAV